MSKRRPSSRRSSHQARGPVAGPGRHRAKDDRPVASEQTVEKSYFTRAAFRELVESVVIAFVLAFLFRTFEAEAFVIPTGSMATTLMGRHKDLECEECGYSYRVNASGEVTSAGAGISGAEVLGCTCPMCGYTMDVGSTKSRQRKYRSFTGDRILVNKFIYQFEEPRRFDVTVFKFPEEAKTNYIKRLVGLPNETVQISHGDLFVKAEGREHFTIARKPPEKLLAMLRPVYDNDFVPPGIIRNGWPAQWDGDGTPGGWATSTDCRSFSIGVGHAEAWLRYRHFLPSEDDWKALHNGPLPPGYPTPKPRLITDYCAYNSGYTRTNQSPRLPGIGLHWVGDLALRCAAEITSDSGEVVFELVEGGRSMQCSIDVATGTATLSISDDSFRLTAATSVCGPGTREIMFANIDDQLRLWVDGRLAKFDKPTTYKPLGNTRPRREDLSPVGIGSRGAALDVSHLKIFRDTYYIADGRRARAGVSGSPVICDFKDPYRVFDHLTPEHIADFFSDPARWDIFDSDLIRTVSFQLEADQFLMLGDNSSQSKDSRLWERDYYVDRRLLVGKAMFIYWPHSWDKIWIGKTAIPFPFFPNFRRMEFVR